MNIPILNIYYLLSYAWNKLDEAKTVPVGQIDKENFPNLFGRILASGTSMLIRRGLDRDYIEKREETRMPRGKINITSTVQKNLFREMKVDCSYDELSYNVLHNQILKSTIGNLRRLRELDEKIFDDLTFWYLELNEVEEIEIRKERFQRLQFNRNNYFYDHLMKICELIYDNLVLDEKGEYSKFKNFVQDSKKMIYLFEAFIANFYKIHREEHRHRVTAQSMMKWDALHRDEYIPVMKPDVVLESKDKVIVLDTKYYGPLSETDRYGQIYKRLHSKDLYQIFSYVKNRENLGGPNENCEGMLLYPTVDNSFPGAEYEIQGHNISVKTINLNQDWQNIHSDLIALVA